MIKRDRIKRIRQGRYAIFFKACLTRESRLSQRLLGGINLVLLNMYGKIPPTTISQKLGVGICNPAFDWVAGLQDDFTEEILLHNHDIASFSKTGNDVSWATGRYNLEQIINHLGWQEKGVTAMQIIAEHLIEIQVSDLVVHASHDDVYLRINDTTRKLNHDEVTRLEYEKKQVRFEDTIEPYAKFDDLDQELLDRYRKALGSDSPIQKILEAKGFQKGEHYTKAAVLLFSKDPTKFMPTARMRFLRYDGTVALPGTQMNIVKEITFDQSIPKILEKAKEVIGMQLRDFQFLGPDARFISLPEYPEFVWMEGMVNALVHRDYSFGGDYVRIKMFDDRLEIFSPSPLPPTITFENTTYTRWSRNERIASVLTLFGWVRELNEGVERMIKDMHEMGLPDLEYTKPNPHSVLLTLRNNIEERKSQKTVSYTEHFDEHSFDGCNDEEIKVLKFVAVNDRITAKEAASVISKAVKSASLLLRRLESRKLLIWNGKSKYDSNQYYSLFQKNK